VVLGVAGGITPDMDNKELIYLFVAIIAIGFFVLPNTLAMFAGQHSWYDPNDDGIPCEKCHFLEAEEMSALVGPHTGETGEGRMECTYCHRGFDIGNSGVAEGNEIDSIFSSYYNSSSRVHAGQTLPCLYCHSGSDRGLVEDHDDYSNNCCQCHENINPEVHDGKFENQDCYRCHGNEIVKHITPAKGLGVTTNTSDTGDRAAHMKFVLDARTMTVLEDANEACLGCHTTTKVNLSWSRLEYIAYDVTANSSGYVVSLNTSGIGGANVSFMSS
jgi:hypothetical protein